MLIPYLKQLERHILLNIFYGISDSVNPKLSYAKMRLRPIHRAVLCCLYKNEKIKIPYWAENILERGLTNAWVDYFLTLEKRADKNSL